MFAIRRAFPLHYRQPTQGAELLGRLAAEFGADILERDIRIVALNSTLRQMANTVIGQRLTISSD